MKLEDDGLNDVNIVLSQYCPAFSGGFAHIGLQQYNSVVTRGIPSLFKSEHNGGGYHLGRPTQYSVRSLLDQQNFESGQLYCAPIIWERTFKPKIFFNHVYRHFFYFGFWVHEPEKYRKKLILRDNIAIGNVTMFHSIPDDPEVIGMKKVIAKLGFSP